MISNRLKAIASLVDTKSIIDVGCDHALLDIYLTKKGIKCRGTDISNNCIMLAKENIKKYDLEDKIELFNTDGVNNINIYDTDTVIVAGMGTKTILNIIEKINDNPLILLSNNDIELLRKEVVKKGYYIDNEIVVKENNYYYAIIKFKKGFKKYKNIDYIVGPILKNNKEYTNYLYNKYLKNYDKIPNKYIFRRIKEKRILNRIKKMIEK